MVFNLKRLFDVDKITTEDQFCRHCDFFYKDIVTLGITILDVTSEDVIKVEELQRYMKPIDSIQLVIALSIKSNDITFVSADKWLCNIAAEEGPDIRMS